VAAGHDVAVVAAAGGRVDQLSEDAASFQFHLKVHLAHLQGPIQ
jgi:hypothetical protein